MNIVAINGSPKLSGGVSGLLLKKLENQVGAAFQVHQAVCFWRREPEPVIISNILSAEVLLVSFPLYVDGLPAPLLKLLLEIEKAAKAATSPRPRVYSLCNCGFYEAAHTRVALKIMRAFAKKAGLSYGYGLGIGGGAMLSTVEKGPAANVYVALGLFGKAVLAQETREEDTFITPKLPRFLYTMAAHWGWRQAAKKYGTQGKLDARPHQL